MNEVTLRRIMLERNLFVVGDSLSNKEKADNMCKALFIIIPPKSMSDRTTLRNVVKYYLKVADSKGEAVDGLFKMIIDFALEASGPFSRVPAAVFISILKKELGYLK